MSRRKLTKADFAALNRGRPITVHPPNGRPAKYSPSRAPAHALEKNSRRNRAHQPPIPQGPRPP